MDFEAARRTMVDTQLRPNDVSDQKWVDAFLSVPRDLFVSKADRSLAYGELELETSPGRRLWTPRDTGKLIAAADPQKSDVVLVIGSGAGYEAALLSRLVSAVIALDETQELADEATRRFSEIGADNAVAVVGDLAAGLPSEGPYDLIYVCGMIEEAPRSWFEQLSESGRLAAAVEVREGLGRGRLYQRAGETVSHTGHFDLSPPKFQQFDRAPVFSF